MQSNLNTWTVWVFFMRRERILQIRSWSNHVGWVATSSKYRLRSIFIQLCIYQVSIKMIFLTMIAMLPLFILSQGVSYSTVYSPECKKAIKALDSSCKAQLADWAKFLKDSCPEAGDCISEKVRSLCPIISKCSER